MSPQANAPLPADQRPLYVVIFRAKPAAMPAPRRLAQLLKFAGRALNLECTEVKEIQVADKPPCKHPERASGGGWQR